MAAPVIRGRLVAYTNISDTILLGIKDVAHNHEIRDATARLARSTGWQLGHDIKSFAHNRLFWRNNRLPERTARLLPHNLAFAALRATLKCDREPC